MAPALSPDIDRILEAIRAEARARGSKGRVGAYSTEAAPGGTIHVVSYGMPALEIKHASDFLALPLDAFIGTAYREVIGREPDAAGAAHYQRVLLRGRLTRIEVLGRLYFSPEGRRHRTAIAGIPAAFALATFYRIPVVGPIAAVVARALRFPAHWLDRSAVESTALASGSWMKR